MSSQFSRGNSPLIPTPEEIRAAIAGILEDWDYAHSPDGQADLFELDHLLETGVEIEAVRPMITLTHYRTDVPYVTECSLYLN